jgi:hypothetical protein
LLSIKAIIQPIKVMYEIIASALELFGVVCMFTILKFDC